MSWLGSGPIAGSLDGVADTERTKMQAGRRDQPEPSSKPTHRAIWRVVATATAGGWLGLLVSVIGWFDEPLVVWFQVSKVATAVGASSGLVFAAVRSIVSMHGSQNWHQSTTAEKEQR